ncbi:MAG: LysM peptidoglycan-binding domain-containing protein [Chloroflexi bacterium]|nr:LysM peptidoglycan-binding domain-containing protein [Chloroflexota bacterium]
MGLGPAPTGTKEVPTGEASPASEATPSVAEAAPTAALPAPTEVPSAASGTGSATGGQVSSYTVQEGDTVYSIARRFNTTPEAIAQFNNLANPDSLVVGQTLQIPSGVSPAGEAQPSGTGKTVYTVQAGDTMFSIAQRYHTTVDAISSANQIYNPWYIHVGQKLVIPGSAGESTAPPTSSEQGTYVVQAGDTLWSISARFGTTPQALAALNNLSSFGFIYPGQVLQLP